MALYYGSSEKLKINLSNSVYNLNIVSLTTMSPTINGIMLKSSDNFVLTDLNGIYLTTKEDK